MYIPGRADGERTGNWWGEKNCRIFRNRRYQSGEAGDRGGNKSPASQSAVETSASSGLQGRCLSDSSAPSGGGKRGAGAILSAGAL